jgi:hypothetical protein
MNVNEVIFIIQKKGKGVYLQSGIPVSSTDFTQYLTWYWKMRMHAHIAAEISYLTIFVQMFHQVAITAGWPEAMWIPKLAQVFHGWPAP